MVHRKQELVMICELFQRFVPYLDRVDLHA